MASSVNSLFYRKSCFKNFRTIGSDIPTVEGIEIREEAVIQ